ncbi:uncharacterized protein [Rutidosis leptorrhynchoides]|uniref:uncharacterized protein isoform X2 n=1 Tax=Rutidosis leptorrhynchoides TaxID=125765 RepID=UPI003A99DBE8
MPSNGGYEYAKVVDHLNTSSVITQDLLNFLESYTVTLYQSSRQDRFSGPMPWIGIYIASASILCIVAMMADLVHGFKSKKLWFPTKYFNLNAASLSVIAVAMKLPMDLNSIMPGAVDQNAKIVSMAFMCTMMANLMPSLATMNNKTLVSNIIGLGILVITVVVNVCIQIRTGVLPYSFDDEDFVISHSVSNTTMQESLKVVERATSTFAAITYVVVPLMFLMMQTCSALAIITSKQILESKYKQVHESSLIDQRRVTSSIENLKQQVLNYWTMAESGNPQIIAACFATSSASGTLCLYNTCIMIRVMTWAIKYLWDYNSDYKWSMVVILLVQAFGVLIGTIAPVGRCFTPLRFKDATSWYSGRMLSIESYWTKKLYDLKKRPSAIIDEPSHVEGNEVVHTRFVLRFQDDMELTERTLKGITQSLNLCIQKGQRKKPSNLKMLINESRGFEGVVKYDNHHISSLPGIEYRNSWSLSLVTLTTIAICLPNIQKNMVERLLRGVSEGLAYVALVEESLNATDDYLSIQKAAKTLWLEVTVDHKWLGYELQTLSPQTDSIKQIILRLRYKADEYLNPHLNIFIPVESTDICNSIYADLMYRITQTIILFYGTSIDQVNHEVLFVRLSSMISDILAACLTNLPQVIVMKCHTTEIEKREESVRAAAQLLGETTEIITILQARARPESLDQDDLPFIDKWRASLNPTP